MCYDILSIDLQNPCFHFRFAAFFWIRTFMYKSSRKAAVAFCTIAGFAIALLGVVVIWKLETATNEIFVTKTTDSTPKWQFQSTTDKFTDEIYTNMHLYEESGSALLSIRCEKMIDVNGANVPIYTLQLATSDYLGKTELFQTRATVYRLGEEHSVNEEWAYNDRNAEQVGPDSEAEVLKRISVVKEIVGGKTFKIRARTYKYEDVDFIFEGRDPTHANERLLAECAERTLNKKRK